MLEVKDLACGYDHKIVLKNINLSVNQGELLGIIGPNGSGKTTLLRTISRVIKPHKGKIIFKKRNINEISFRELAKDMAVVSQNSSGFEFHMSVEEFVYMGRIPYRRGFQLLENKTDEIKVDEAMASTDIAQLTSRYMSELSGGERQRTVIAKALAQEPQLLLLDEPTTHLDITHQVEILDLVKRLNTQRKLTIIMILHDLNLASEYCDRLILLKEGQIHKEGTPQEVLTYPIIEEVYNTLVVIQKSPISSRPWICLVPEHEKKVKKGTKE